MSRTSPANRHVYVIGPPVGLQKVGIATDPKQRLATLQTACPFDLFLHLAVAVPFGEAHAIERQAHRLLARSCVRNEWFETTAKEAIAAVRKAVAGRPARSAQAAPVEWLAGGPGCRSAAEAYGRLDVERLWRADESTKPMSMHPRVEAVMHAHQRILLWLPPCLR